jgi:hypothetical protein
MKYLCKIALLAMISMSVFLPLGCAGPFNVNYSVVEDNGMYPVVMDPMFDNVVVESSETVQYDGRGGSKVVSEEGLDPLEASGVKEEENLTEYGIGRQFGLEEGKGLMP